MITECFYGGLLTGLIFGMPVGAIGALTIGRILPGQGHRENLSVAELLFWQPYDRIWYCHGGSEIMK